jgi:hypothetical protein
VLTVISSGTSRENQSYTPQEVLHMTYDKLDPVVFGESLARGRPIVVTGLQRRLQGKWDPTYFIERFGSQKVTLIDCETESQVKSTVADFFQGFGPATGDKRIVKLKARAIWIPSLPLLNLGQSGLATTG